MKVENVWDFVEKYYPKYSSCDSIAYNDDLQKIKDGEINGQAENLYKQFVEQVKEETETITLTTEELDAVVLAIVEKEWNESCADIFERSIEGFVEKESKLKSKEEIVEKIEQIKLKTKEVLEELASKSENAEDFEIESAYKEIAKYKSQIEILNWLLN